jgi:3-isopropylmalate dehydratase
MPGFLARPQTLYDKVFKDHVVDEKEDGTILLYVGALRARLVLPCLTSPTDRHLVHEVTSPVRVVRNSLLPHC